MEFIQNNISYITNPFISFVFGITIMYGVLLGLDSILRTKNEKQQDQLYNRVKKCFGHVKELTAVRYEQDETIGITEYEIEILSIKLEETIEVYDDLLDKQYRDKAKLNEQVTSLQQERTTLSGELETKKTDLEQQTTDFSKELEELRNELENSRKQLQGQMRNMEQENASLKAKLDEQIAALQQERTTLSSELEAVRSKKAGLERQAADLSEELEKLRNELENSRKQLQEQMRNMEKENASLKAELNKQAALLQQERTTLSSELEAVRSKKTGLERQTVDLSEELKKLRNEHENSRKQLQDQMRNMNEENASLKAELSRCVQEEDVQLLKDKKNILTAQMNQYKIAYMDLKGQLGKYRSQETVGDPLLMMGEDPVAKTLYQENKKLSKKVGEYQNTIDSLKLDLQELETLYDENQRLKKEIGEMANKDASAIPEKIKIPEKPLAAVKEIEETANKDASAIPEKIKIPEKPSAAVKTQKESPAKKKKSRKVRKVKKKGKKPGKSLDKIQESKKPVEAFDDFALSDDDLISEIEEPVIPRVTKTIGLPSSAPPGKEPEGAKKDKSKKPYNVFLPRLTTEEKREKAIPLLVEISGLSEEEAIKLSNRTVIPVVKGVDRETANKIKERFQKIGILPRIKRQI